MWSLSRVLLQRIAAVVALAGAVACGHGRPDGMRADEAGWLRAHGVDVRRLRCRGHQSWQPHLHAAAKATASEALEELTRGPLSPTAGGPALDDARRTEAVRLLTERIFWRLVRTGIVEGGEDNLGAVPLEGVQTADGQPVLLVRGAFTARPDAEDSCLGSLIGAAGVRHVVNLYAGPMVTADLEAAERRAIEQAGGTYTTAREQPGPVQHWRDELREGDAKAAHEAMAQLVRMILRPDGKPPTGHVMVHCGGGMHRTGMVVGVIERCLNRAPRAEWEARYRHHVAWRSTSQPGGFEQANVDFIAGFPCELLAR
jgi:protein-tyrosine phosphatase